MITNRNAYSSGRFQTVATRATKAPVRSGNNNKDKFTVYSYAMNEADKEHKGGIDKDNKKVSFPGNISPEGYFYSPFYEVTLKELDDELQSVQTRTINFNPEDTASTVSEVTVECYDPETGAIQEKKLYIISLITPVPYEFILHQPFCIYDVLKDTTYRGYLYNFETVEGYKSYLEIATDAKIVDELRSKRYIISVLTDNAPEYAEYIPASNKLIWRAPKKMSTLSNDSPIYNMPFTNGRLYIHKNLNVFVRRQDPNNDFKLFKPSNFNPLRRFQVEGDAKLDFGYIQTIIDSMVDAC